MMPPAYNSRMWRAVAYIPLIKGGCTLYPPQGFTGFTGDVRGLYVGMYAEHE